MAALTRERLDDDIEVLRLDRPEVRNAMDSAMLAELDAVLAELALDETLKALVVSTTNERALCAGADVSEQLDHEAGVARMEAFARLYAAIEAFPAPTIAVCVGNVVGAGAEVAAGCDLRVGGDNLKLVFPGAKLGVPVGPARLVPLVGLSKARELIMTGRVVAVDEAEALGLLARRTTAADAEAEAIALARELTPYPAAGLRHLKDLFREYEGTKYRVARENAEIVEFQRTGGGLPYGGVKK
ncbi:MAG TPA: enoyl-CoA hydratase/isomerase family protein [Baekduia sp.]|uniref:enoyl-CoA hydratase/isomerase family protein n=1 Tax=Baekduia sp. TaxID=2600305 RepID=UPI002D788CB7|nr:enoyl-CoA hydratase/isomerase family protein [Baekduia sp.]HET6506833.1 enoyl-CoA hydratase/isomerase family protein [Baekduia sp.]